MLAQTIVLAFVVFLKLPLLEVVHACEIHGHDVGECTKRYLPATYGEGLDAITTANKQWMNGTEGECSEGQGDHCMPFCGVYLANYYPPCVPSSKSLPRDQNFLDGRHMNHTTRTKDRWIETTALETLRNDEFRRKKRDCREAYKRYLCWVNFPRCDEEERSLPMCSSVCRNMLKACGFTTELETLCSASSPSEVSAGSFFPGQPFQPNQFLSRGEPALVCTPSIKNGAREVVAMYSAYALVSFGTAAAFILFG